MINFHWSDVIFVFKVIELYGGEGKLKIKKKNKVEDIKWQKYSMYCNVFLIILCLPWQVWL